MTFIEEKIRISCENLKNLILLNSSEIAPLFVFPCDYKKGVTFPDKDADWQNMEPGYFTLEPDSHFWIHFETDVPQAEENRQYYLSLKTGFEDAWDARNPQCMVYVNGNTITQAFDTNHTHLALTAGHKDIYIYFYSGTDLINSHTTHLQINLELWDTEIEDLYYDLSVPYESMKTLSKNGIGEGSFDYLDIRGALDSATQLLDFRHSYSPEFYEGIRAAKKYMSEEFYAKLCGRSQSEISYIGHTHIDIAWLWTVAQTREKAQRSFSTVLELMQQFDEYRFMSSQPILYQMVKEEDPQLYEKIKERVAEGRWEVEGAMWLEADTNITGGESLIRQILVGKKFMKDEFGVESNCLWLPDVFGYSAALPQILKKSGVDRFFTTKISWSETNRFPHDTFLWKGLDGTEIFSVLSVGYVRKLNPDQSYDVIKSYADKKYSKTQLATFGFGDGGGGPTKEMLENYRRMKYGIPGMPKVSMRKSGETIDIIEQNFRENCEKFKFVPKWSGELYLEMHRGTYTSIAKNKKNNRVSEFLYQKTETANVISGLLENTAYPKQEIDEAWKIILLNQFHDIIPGSSIKDVYDNTDKQYAKIIADGNQLYDNALNKIKANISTKGGYFVYNPNSFPVSDVVKTADGKEIFAKNIPAHGYAVVKDSTDKSVRMTAENRVLENDKVKVTFDEQFHIISIWDKNAEREIIVPGGKANVLEIFEDYPRAYDAWEITEYYKQKKWIVDELSSAEYFKTPYTCGVIVKRKYQASSFEQIIRLRAGSARVDFETTVDWHEDHVLLKAAFPFDIHSNTADYEIQFGHISRPTHHNNSWDEAQFEVCAHKWADISEADYGVSLMNNCKYGYNTEENVMKLSLLKAATNPNPEADRGINHFTYAVYPHENHSVLGGIVKEAYLLNNPLTCTPIDRQKGSLAERYSFVSTESENIIIETVKQAEDGSGIILRAYDAFGVHSKPTFRFGSEITSASLCNMMETELSPLDCKQNSVTAAMHPFEIITIKLVPKK